MERFGLGSEDKGGLEGSRPEDSQALYYWEFHTPSTCYYVWDYFLRAD